MSSSFSGLAKIISLILCAVAVCGAVCLTLALNRDYSLTVHHFSTGSTLYTAALILTLSGAVLALVLTALAVFLRPQENISPAGSVTVFFAALVGFLMLAGFIVGLLGFSGLAGGWLERIRLALMALSAFYFLYTVSQRDALSPLAALFSLAPILYAFLSMMTVYFDASMGMNSPLKAYRLMMYLAMALFFTAEVRRLLRGTHLSAYCLFAGLCLTLCGIVGGAQIATAVYDTRGFGFSLPESGIALGVALFAACRLCALRIPEESTSQKEPAEIGESATEEGIHEEN